MLEIDRGVMVSFGLLVIDCRSASLINAIYYNIRLADLLTRVIAINLSAGQGNTLISRN